MESNPCDVAFQTIYDVVLVCFLSFISTQPLPQPDEHTPLISPDQIT